MARVAEAAAADFTDRVRVEKVITRTPAGAKRYMKIMTLFKRQIAVPSILINGEPVFEKIPGVDELKQRLHLMMGEN
nr:hypothetical protein [Desulfospira joergensenii]